MENSKPSKSAKKREFLELQELGEQLVSLNEDQLVNIQLDENLRDAVIDAKSIHSHGALRRQKQLIGKLMRGVDPGPIRAGLALASRDDREAKLIFKAAEDWRDRLVSGRMDAVVDFCAETGANPESFESLLKQYHASPDEASRKRIRRMIFRRVHEQLHLMVQKDTD